MLAHPDGKLARELVAKAPKESITTSRRAGGVYNMRMMVPKPGVRNGRWGNRSQREGQAGKGTRSQEEPPGASRRTEIT